MDDRKNRSRPAVRRFCDADRDVILSLAARLAVGIGPWRSHEGMVAAARGWTAASLDGVGPDQAVFVAERDGEVVGFAAVSRQTEFTGEEQAYIGELAVDESAEGLGAGHALLLAVEEWASSNALALLVLDTGAANSRALRFYGRNGFVEESVRLTKVLTTHGSATEE